MDGAGREDNGVVVLAQVGEGWRSLPYSTLPKKRMSPRSRTLCSAVMMPINARVIRCHTVTNQAEGGGVAVEDVDGDLNGAGADLFGLGEDMADLR